MIIASSHFIINLPTSIDKKIKKIGALVYIQTTVDTYIYISIYIYIHKKPVCLKWSLDGDQVRQCGMVYDKLVNI